MRLRSDIFVSALLRRVFSAGDFAAVLRKGSEAAGAIFIRTRSRDGREHLYGPAPQSLFSEDPLAARQFEARLGDAGPSEIDAALDREVRFDPDCWIVELEIDERGDLFDVV